MDLKRINRNINKLKGIKKISKESIVNKNSMLRLNSLTTKEEESAKLISEIESIMGLEDWESATNRSLESIKMFNRFMKFINNPRKIIR